ncbi:hypothetical protein Taro_030762 [Colocasia esculenta]|uniref:Uncharacterized protein n=1 Tax=Colocasia esculenta TaxID=4460 RepID=A0A843VUW5_COLES|nr:hypothetical protein [Colocasia esculenta]
MGDVHVCRPRATDPLGGEPSLALASHPPNPRPSEVSTENWRLSERATEKIIRQIQPTGTADRRRREVVEYVRGLIKAVADAEASQTPWLPWTFLIFPFGSVPLKTYLPDGDIDLTAMETPRSEDTLARDVLAVLQAEEQNGNSEFEVKDVQYIHAEVRLVKCLVDNIVVDISFQQIGGLCTLCFLEKVDRMIGKNHLFKRSIILIKAWCYYESRILGAHHGLISTYALETLVLYIFHVFHSSLDGPLAVLYRFLDYFGTFNWEKYCVSLNGPVCLSSLPEIVAESPENDGGDLLLSKDFLKSCENAFTSVFKWSDNSSTSRSFHQKHLNIIDPLKANNNLGRSVNKGNFYRIRSAFQFGARKLGSILTLPGEKITDAVIEFFKNALERHDSRERPDGGDGVFPDSLPSISGDLWTFGTEKDIDSTTSLPSPIDFHGRMVTEPMIQTELYSQTLCNQLAENCLHRFTDAQSNSLAEGNGILDIRRAGDAKDMSEGTDPRNTRSICKPLSSRNEVGNSAPLKIHHAPHLFFCKENGNVSCYEPEPKKILSDAFQRRSMSVSTDYIPDGEVSKDMATSNCCPESPGPSDLTGDYDAHMKNLLFAMGCLDRQPSPLFYNQLHQDPLYQLNMFTHMNANGMVPGPFPTGSYYPLGATFIPGAFSLEELPRTRGTGTYFPNANHWSYLERRSPGRGRNHASASQSSRSRNNGRASTTADKALADKVSHESTSHAQGHHPNGNVHLRPGQLEAYQASFSSSRGLLQSNGLASTPDNGLEFGTFGCVKVATPPSETRRNLDAHAPHGKTSGTTELPSAAQNLGVSSTDERPRRTYHLKNEDDFPPLRGLWASAAPKRGKMSVKRNVRGNAIVACLS